MIMMITAKTYKYSALIKGLERTISNQDFLIKGQKEEIGVWKAKYAAIQRINEKYLDIIKTLKNGL